MASHVKRGNFDEAAAREAFDAFFDIRQDMLLVDPDLARSLDVAMQLRIYAYDAYMLVNAIEHDAELLTLDLPMRRHAKPLGIRLEEL